MSESSERFCLLILDILKLEEEYEKAEYKYGHLLFLLKKFGMENYDKMNAANLECEIAKAKIKVLKRQLSKLEHNTMIATYYALYIEKSELLKKLYACKTKIGYINSTFVFGNVSNKKFNKKLFNKLNYLKKEIDLAIKQSEEITLKMNSLQFAKE